MFLCATSGGRVGIVETDGPVSVSVRLPFAKRGYVLGHPVLRDGWMLMERESWLSIRDGDPASATPLPGEDYVAAADPALAICVIDDHHAVVDVDGAVHAEVDVPWRTPMPERGDDTAGMTQGQLADGSIVKAGGAFSLSDGSLVREWPRGLEAAAVLRGRWVMLEPAYRSDRGPAVLDVETDELLEAPGDPELSYILWIHSPGLEACATYPLPMGRRTGGHPIVVARAGEVPRTFDQPLSYPSYCWLDDRRLLIQSERKFPFVLDTISGELTERRDIPKNMAARVEITGRGTAAAFEAAFPPQRKKQAGPVEHPLPTELRDFLERGEQLSASAAACCGTVVLAASPQRATLPVDTDDRPWEVDDPHRGDGGHYEVPAMSLVDDCEHEYNPLGLLVWLPVEACFGSWDPEHWDLLTFPGATWADIVADPARYLDAIDDPSSKDPYLVPVGHPYVMPEPTDERDAD